MFLNTLSPNYGAKQKPKRLGRGIGSGLGKTCGKGHKGQKARAGGYHKVGFEGGQMPLARRLPKFGFTSYKKTITAEITLSDLESLPVEEVTLKVLRQANLINHSIRYVKVINKGNLSKALVLRGIKATCSAKGIIETLGGQLES